MQVSSIKPVLVAKKKCSDNALPDRNLLQRNLLLFSRSIDPVAGDGDCAFRSIIIQLRKSREWIE